MEKEIVLLAQTSEFIDKHFLSQKNYLLNWAEKNRFKLDFNHNRSFSSLSYEQCPQERQLCQSFYQMIAQDEKEA